MPMAVPLLHVLQPGLSAARGAAQLVEHGSLPRELIGERLGVHRVVDRNQCSATMKTWQ